MSITDPLVLTPDTTFTPIADLPESVREQVQAQFGQRTGYALTQPHARRPSTLVDDETAELLRDFATPSTIADAVIRYSRRRGLDPEQVLEESFLTLRRCLEEGYLVVPGTERARRQAATLGVGDRVVGGVVLRCLHSLEDTEIYQLALDTGGLAALKVLPARGFAAGHVPFQREAAILRHLDGVDAPRLLSSGVTNGADGTDGYAWMLLEWCEGVPAGVAAAALRQSPGQPPGESPDGAAGLLALCLRVTQAYARLHANGVVHGDAHPGNLIVSPDGTVRIVDFGIARWPGLRDLPGAEPPRGGVPGYIAPDQARAMLAGVLAGPATESSDLYCLAVLLYELFTGHGYLEFSLEEREMLRKIAEDPPLPFTRVGRRPGRRSRRRSGRHWPRIPVTGCLRSRTWVGGWPRRMAPGRPSRPVPWSVSISCWTPSWLTRAPADGGLPLACPRRRWYLSPTARPAWPRRCTVSRSSGTTPSWPRWPTSGRCGRRRRQPATGRSRTPRSS